jgi:hypothetical protein
LNQPHPDRLSMPTSKEDAMTGMADKTKRRAGGLMSLPHPRFGLGAAIYALGLLHGLALLHRVLF